MYIISNIPVLIRTKMVSSNHCLLAEMIKAQSYNMVSKSENFTGVLEGTPLCFLSFPLLTIMTATTTGETYSVCAPDMCYHIRR